MEHKQVEASFSNTANQSPMGNFRIQLIILSSDVFTQVVNQFMIGIIYLFTVPKHTSLCIYMKGAHVHKHRVDFFVANPRRKGNTKLPLCKAAYFILMPTLIYPTNPILKTTVAILLLSSNESSKARFTRTELSACWVVPAGDVTRTSQCIEKILHFIFDFPTHIPRSHIPSASDLARRQALRAQPRIQKCLYSFQAQRWPCTNSAFKTG